MAFIDAGNFIIRSIGNSGVLGVVAGTPGVAGFSPDGVLANSSFLWAPTGLASDGASGWFFVDSVLVNGSTTTALRRVLPNGTLATVVVGVPPQDAVPQGSTLSADGSGGLYVSSVASHAVFHYRPGATTLALVTGTGQDCRTIAGSLAQGACMPAPASTAFSGTSALWIADAGATDAYPGEGGYLWRSTPAADGVLALVAGGNGTASVNPPPYNGDGGPGTGAALAAPTGIFPLPDGSVVFIDSGHAALRRVASDASATLSLIAGTGGVFGYAGDGGDPTAALLAPSNASGVASDYAGGWWLTDTLNNAVRHILPGDAAGPDSLGGLAGCSILLDRWLLNCTLAGVSPLPPLWAYLGGTACRTLSQPVTLGAVINLLCPLPLASTNATTLEWYTPIGRSSANVSVSLPTPTQTPSISLTASQTPTISDSSSQSGSFSASSSHTPSQSLTASMSPSQFRTPSITPSQSPSVTPAAPGSTAVGFTIETIAGTAGVRGTSGNGGLALDALLTSPNAVAADGQGGVFVAESFGSVGVNTLRHILANGTIVLVAGVPGLRGYFGDGGPASTALLNSPSGIRVAPTGDIILADRKNGRVRCIFFGNASISTVAGSGRDDFGDGAALNSSFSLPSDVALVPGSGGPQTWSYYVAVSW